MIRPLALAALAASLPAAAPGQAVLSAEGMAGVGVQGCETVSGVENAPMLAAAVDWGLGYLAGRRDGGHRPVPGEPLSTTDPADLATGIVLYCRENPYGLVLDALRAYGQRVFAEGPEADPAQQPRLPRTRPPRRPEDAPALVAAAATRAQADTSGDEAAGATVEPVADTSEGGMVGAVAEPVATPDSEPAEASATEAGRSGPLFVPAPVPADEPGGEADEATSKPAVDPSEGGAAGPSSATVTSAAAEPSDDRPSDDGMIEAAAEAAAMPGPEPDAAPAEGSGGGARGAGPVPASEDASEGGAETIEPASEPEPVTRSAAPFDTVAVPVTPIERMARRRRALAAEDARARGVLPPLAPAASPWPPPRPDG